MIFIVQSSSLFHFLLKKVKNPRFQQALALTFIASEIIRVEVARIFGGDFREFRRLFQTPKVAIYRASTPKK